ncbi:MAG: TRAP transporter substrate-binding protein [Desulfobulbaceae bacterium]|nr:MAG: TRAP transporter substrate-binding protein [Desulfobulbaceae bacterium]
MTLILFTCVLFLLFTNQGFSKSDPLAQWQPNFDPSTAKHTYLLSCVGHPAIEGVAVGYRIRDRVWQETGGQLYVDFRPLSQLGGEKDVINKLKFGAIHGMLSSSVAAANIAPRLGVVNLPFLINDFEELDRFRDTPALWEPFSTAAASSGLEVLDFTGYGSYGWATTTPVTSLEEARQVNFRIAQAPVNIDAYKIWKLKFSVLPWPDVPQALQTGVINGLDHTPIVCNISKKFTVAKYYTELNYAQGLYVHIINKRWLNSIPADVRDTLLRIIREESSEARKLTHEQQKQQIAAAKADGITFLSLNDADKATLIEGAAQLQQSWQEKVGAEYLQALRKAFPDN